MPYVLEDLVVDRVDLVDEGANSAAFIKICKRKEQTKPMELSEILSKMKPEHAEVVQKAFDELNDELGRVRTSLGTAEDELKKYREAPAEPVGTDEEEVLKSMPEAAREAFINMRAQKEAAEEQVRKAAEEKAHAEAVAKAKSLKALPVDEETLTEIVKGCDARTLELLTNAAAAIESTALSEVGKRGQGPAETDAWAKIEAEAAKIAERDGVTVQKAVGTAIKEHPDLYREYLNGGKN
jgi:hypothetical protein